MLRILLFFSLLIPTFAHADPDDRSGDDGQAPIQHILQSSNKSEALQEEDQSYLLRYNPFYFAYGNPLSKLQVSFRTKLIRRVPLYFAYTQQMFWALTQNSKPFRDLTYNPEFFYRFNLPNWGWWKSFDVGYAHNSNGKDGNDSRSFNTGYVRGNFEKEFRRWIFRFAVRGGYLHDFDDTNKDIQKYVGPISYKLSWIQLYDAWVDKSELSIEALPGGKFGQNIGDGGYQFSWAFRIGGIDLLPSFYLQYYMGYGETLLNYNQYVHAFRGGIIF